MTTAMLDDFVIIWGAKWSSAIAECDYGRVIDLWSEEVAKLDEKELERAIKVCKSIYDFPPSMPQFIRAAFAFHDDNKSFRIASRNMANDIWAKYNMNEASDWIVYSARSKASELFNSMNNHDVEYQRKEWYRIYHDEIDAFLKSLI